MSIAPRTIGGHPVFPVGFGAMRLSLEGRPDEAQAIRTIHAALDAGATLIDTADVYCAAPAEFGHNERLVARALASWGGNRDAVLVATKGGHYRTKDLSWQQDGRPASLRAACEASLRALGTDCIGLYQYHSPDPTVPFAESVGALADLKREGKVRLVGLSNVGRKLIAEARAITEIASVQDQFSPAVRESQGVIPYCADFGIAFLCWSPLGGTTAAELAVKAPAVAQVAAARGVSPQRVALAWELAQGANAIPIPGARRVETALDSLAAADLELSGAELALISG